MIYILVILFVIIFSLLEYEILHPKVDLNKCKNGSRLRTRSGYTAYYSHRNDTMHYISYNKSDKEVTTPVWSNGNFLYYVKSGIDIVKVLCTKMRK